MDSPAVCRRRRGRPAARPRRRRHEGDRRRPGDGADPAPPPQGAARPRRGVRLCGRRRGRRGVWDGVGRPHAPRSAAGAVLRERGRGNVRAGRRVRLVPPRRGGEGAVRSARDLPWTRGARRPAVAGGQRAVPGGRRAGARRRLRAGARCERPDLPAPAPRRRSDDAGKCGRCDRAPHAGLPPSGRSLPAGLANADHPDAHLRRRQVEQRAGCLPAHL